MSTTPDTLPLYQVDAFARRLFTGNPAAVVPLDRWLPDPLLQAIAAENNLSETAYVVPDPGADAFLLRWFTPTREVRLCGHATLAAGHVVLTHREPARERVAFHTREAGVLGVARTPDGYAMSLPADIARVGSDGDAAALGEALGVAVDTVLWGIDDAVAVVGSPDGVRGCAPDPRRLAALTIRGRTVRGVGITAHDGDDRIVSRAFYPAYGVDEDPVTGSLHTLLAPWWCARLGVTTLRATQGGRRTGTLSCTWDGGADVVLSGGARTYLEGTISLPTSDAS